MDILGVVPARGGSSGVAKKSIAPLAGQPLLAYTAEAVRSSRRLTRTVLTTDDEGIARVGEQCGLEVPFMRPSELAAEAPEAIHTVGKDCSSQPSAGVACRQSHQVPKFVAYWP